MYAEVYTPLPCAANFTGFVNSASCTLGYFLCSVTGTMTLQYESAAGATILNAMPVTAGVAYPLLYAMPTGAYITLAGGAAGTISWRPG